MLSANALRHQMILPEQQSIYDYWRSKCRGGSLPRREDIHPTDLAQYLPTISLIELCSENQKCQFKYRLAGTRFYDIYKQELTGQYVSDMPKGSSRDYWGRVLTRIVDTRRPSAGVVRSALSGKTHMAQFWIRLPLTVSDAKTDMPVKMILGFDKFVRLSEMKAAESDKSKIYA